MEITEWIILAAILDGPIAGILYLLWRYFEEKI